MAHLQKKVAPQGEKPEAVRTHLRDMVIVPEMIGSVIGVYNGKTFNQVEIKVCTAACPNPARSPVARVLCDFVLTLFPLFLFPSRRWWAPTQASTASHTSP